MLLEKFREDQKEIIRVFVDLTKVYERVKRDEVAFVSGVQEETCIGAVRQW